MVTAHSLAAPEKVWIGVTIGEWPIQAFHTEEGAQRWSAAQVRGENLRYVLGPIPLPRNLPARRAHNVPATLAWVEDEPTTEEIE